MVHMAPIKDRARGPKPSSSASLHRQSCPRTGRYRTTGEAGQAVSELFTAPSRRTEKCENWFANLRECLRDFGERYAQSTRGRELSHAAWSAQVIKFWVEQDYAIPPRTWRAAPWMASPI